jgi:hypothetical protein
MTKFRDLQVGETFDFIGPNRMLVSFWKRCTKKSGRLYEDEDGDTHHVGSINAKVYNVNAAA